MEKYESKQVKINKPEALIFTIISDFNHFTPILKDKVEEWNAESDICSFKIKGFTAKLRIAERTPHNCVKVTGDESSPFEFAFWIQLKQLSETDTRMKITLHAKLNMMMKMMLGGKLKSGLDEMAEKIAEAFNSTAL